MSRTVLAELAGVWADVWEEAIAMRERSPDLRARALTRTADPALAIVELQPALAQLHPRVAASVLAFCRAIRDEFSFEAVTPGREHTFVVDDEIVGGQQHDDRLAMLEDENEALRQRVQRLEAGLTMARAAMERAVEEPTA